MKTSHLVMLGVGAFLLYKLLHKTTTVTLPGASATPLLPASGDAMSVGLNPPNMTIQTPTSGTA